MHHHHALGPARCPRLARVARNGPQVDRQHFTWSTGAWRFAGRLGVDQVEVAVTGPRLVRDVLDLAAHPELAAAGERPDQGVLHLAVEVGDGEDPGTGQLACREQFFGSAGHGPTVLGAAERARRSGRQGTGTLSGTVNRPGGRGLGRTSVLARSWVAWPGLRGKSPG